jgi:hypothetical protein
MRHATTLNVRMLAFFLLCVTVVSSCHSGNNAETQTDGNVAHSSLARDTNPQVSDADLATVVGGNTDFALKAFSRSEQTLIRMLSSRRTALRWQLPWPQPEPKGQL